MPKVLRRKAVVDRIDPDEDFSDVDGDFRSEFAITEEESKHPDRKMIWVHNDPDSIAEYKMGIGGVGSLACRLERRNGEQDDPDTKAGKGQTEVGDVITRRDHILMSCDKQLWLKRARLERKQAHENNARLARARQGTSTAGKHRAEWSYVQG